MSDGSSAGTALVQDIAIGVTGGTPKELTAIGVGPQARLLFTVDDLEHGRELWSVQLDQRNLFAPSARPGSAIAAHNTPASGRLGADDRDGNPPTFALADLAHKGVLVLDNPATGAFTYTPDPGATGVDRFTFVASDGAFVSAAATVVVLIDPWLTFAPLVDI